MFVGAMLQITQKDPRPDEWHADLQGFVSFITMSTVHIIFVEYVIHMLNVSRECKVFGSVHLISTIFSVQKSITKCAFEIILT